MKPRMILGKGGTKISKTSIVISTYNDAEYLKRLIPSVINQSLKPLEIIIIDDGSEDDMAEDVINLFIDLTDIPIVFEKKENGGPSSARNVGIKLAKGEFVLFIDADDELLPDSIEWRQKIMESLGEDYASIYCSSIDRFKKKPDYIEHVKEISGEINVCLLGRKNGIPGGSPYHFFRRKVLLMVNGYSESLKFNEDFELILRIARKWIFFGVNRTGFIRHIREGSWSRVDPYVAYTGVEGFLAIAANEKLLPMIEINKRKKENILSLVKKLVVQRREWFEVNSYLDKAFNISGPQNIKEFILFTLNKMINIAKKMK